MKTFSVEPGDRVAYAIHFLKSIGCISGPMPRLRGEVLIIKHVPNAPSLVYVQWSDGTIGKVIEPNLARLGMNTRFASC